MQLTITIRMDNASFGDSALERQIETRAILACFTERCFVAESGESGLLMDGNAVGRWVVE